MGRTLTAGHPCSRAHSLARLAIDPDRRGGCGAFLAARCPDVAAVGYRPDRRRSLAEWQSGAFGPRSLRWLRGSVASGHHLPATSPKGRPGRRRPHTSGSRRSLGRLDRTPQCSVVGINFCLESGCGPMGYRPPRVGPGSSPVRPLSGRRHLADMAARPSGAVDAYNQESSITSGWNLPSYRRATSAARRSRTAARLIEPLSDSSLWPASGGSVSNIRRRKRPLCPGLSRL